jgi:hypothetical protein
LDHLTSRRMISEPRLVVNNLQQIGRRISGTRSPNRRVDVAIGNAMGMSNLGINSRAWLQKWITDQPSLNHSYPKLRAMKSLFHAGTLTTAILAAGVACRAQNVYSINGVVEGTFLAAQHRPDEIAIWGCRDGSGAQASRVEWYVSTNALAKQPRWDGLSAEVPLSARKACGLALPLVRERLPRVKSWAVESILLRKPYVGEPEVYPDVWYYEIHFKPSASRDPAKKEYDTRHCGATQIVLLDGTVVPQTVLKRK